MAGLIVEAGFRPCLNDFRGRQHSHQMAVSTLEGSSLEKGLLKKQAATGKRPWHLRRDESVDEEAVGTK